MKLKKIVHWGQLEYGPRKPLRITRNNGVWENPNLVKAREEEKQRGEGDRERKSVDQLKRLQSGWISHRLDSRWQ
jgi:hypothetical protein